MRTAEVTAVDRLVGTLELCVTIASGPSHGEMLHGWVRTSAGEAYFAHSSDVRARLSPRRFDRLAFTPGRDPMRPEKLRAFDSEIVERHHDPLDVPQSDVTIACVDCGDEFVWTLDSQRAFRARRFRRPRRCKSCR